MSTYSQQSACVRETKGYHDVITTKFKVCKYVHHLLSFGAESVVFQVAIQKLKDQDI